MVKRTGVVKLQTNKRVKKNQRVTTGEKIGFFLLAFLLFILAATYVFSSLGPVQTPLTALEESRQSLLALEGYAFETREWGSGYTITFRGYQSGDKLLGEISEYDITVYEEKGALYLQQEEGKWVEARELGLEKLSCFLQNPAHLLEQVAASDNRQNIRFQEEERLLHLPHRASRNALVHSLFPGISGSSVKDFDIFIRFKEGVRLDRIEMVLHLLTADSTEEVIHRTVTLLEEGEAAGGSYPDIHH